jgi:hypothetical protein
MTALALFVFLLMPAQHPTDAQESLLRCVGGSVVYQHEVPSKKASANPHYYKTTSMRGVPVFIYPRQSGVSCCDGLSRVASLETGRSGRFEFKDIRPEVYSFVVRSNNHAATRAIRFEPIKGYSPSSPAHTFALDDAGDLKIGVTVTVD